MSCHVPWDDMYTVIIDTTEWIIRVFYVMGTHTQRSKLQYSYHVMSCHIMFVSHLSLHAQVCAYAVMFIDMTEYIL